MKLFRDSDTPLLIMMCGLPASGKSTLANKITVDFEGQEYKPIIHSSDKLRAELYGDESIQGDNNKIFIELHKRIKNDILKGKDVIYDATCINKKKRIQFLKELNNIVCTPICIVMATEYEVCLHNNAHRIRKVPTDVIRRMFLNYQPPHESEGFQKILYVFTYLTLDKKLVNYQLKDKHTLSNFFKVANNFDQENKHHSLTLGQHCAKAGAYIQTHCPNDFWLLITALLHDIGKLETKTKVNFQGIEDRDAHYYNHNCVGSYTSMFILSNIENVWGKPCPMSDITNMIFYHMHPFLSWEQSEKVKDKDKELIGDKMFNDIILLHEADYNAH